MACRVTLVLAFPLDPAVTKTEYDRSSLDGLGTRQKKKKIIVNDGLSANSRFTGNFHPLEEKLTLICSRQLSTSSHCGSPSTKVKIELFSPFTWFYGLFPFLLVLKPGTKKSQTK